MSETTEQKKKLQSRKFIVWIVASAYEAACLVYAFIAHDAVLAQQFTPYWGGISMLYIGGNVAQKYIEKEKKDA